MSESQPKPLEGGSTHEEDASISRKPYVLFCVLFIVALLVIGVLLYGLQLYLRASLPQASVPPLTRSWEPPPSPQLQGTRVHPNLPHEDLQAYLADQREQLNRYAWIDRDEGTARIPIERAMTLILERGLPARSPPATGPAQTRPARPRPGSEQEDTTSRGDS